MTPTAGGSPMWHAIKHVLTNTVPALPGGGDHAASQPQTMQVIGAGFGRTGTDSLRRALNMLGYNTYHMEEVARLNHMPMWGALGETAAAHAAAAHAAAANAAAGAASTPQDLATVGTGASGITDAELARHRAAVGPIEAVDSVLDELGRAGFNATTDFPACLVYSDMLRRNPNARVILSARVTPEQWVKSFRSTIGRMAPLSTQAPVKFVPGVEWVTAWMDAVTQMRRSPTALVSADVARAAYVRWVDLVSATVPPEQLLVYRPGDGWEPLCAHLGIDPSAARCPASRGVPYPRGNSAASMQVPFFLLEMATYTWPLSGLLVAMMPVLACVGCWRGCRRCCGARGASSARASKLHDV